MKCIIQCLKQWLRPLRGNEIPQRKFIEIIYCGIEQWPARKPHKLQVGGSNPSPATKFVRLQNATLQDTGKKEGQANKGTCKDILS